MLHQQGLEPAEVVRLEPAKHPHVLLGHLEGRALEVDAAGSGLEDEGEVDVEDGSVLADHDVGVVAVLDVQQVLDEAEARVALREAREDRLGGVLLAEVVEVGEEAAALVRSLDLVDGPAAFDKLIKCAVLLGQYLVGHDVLLAEDGVDVLDELHGDDLVGQLVVVLVEVLAELEVQDQRVSVLGLDVVAVLDCYFGDLAQLVACADVESPQLRLLALRLAVRALLLHLRQQAVYLGHLRLEAGALLLVALHPEDLLRQPVQPHDDLLPLHHEPEPALFAEGLLEGRGVLLLGLLCAVDELLVVLAGGEGELALGGGGELGVEEVLEDVAVLG